MDGGLDWDWIGIGIGLALWSYHWSLSGRQGGGQCLSKALGLADWRRLNPFYHSWIMVKEGSQFPELRPWYR
jgi:hypothetical protein